MRKKPGHILFLRQVLRIVCSILISLQMEAKNRKSFGIATRCTSFILQIVLPEKKSFHNLSKGNLKLILWHSLNMNIWKKRSS